MSNEFGLGLDLMTPTEGPPLPRSLGIYWPWYKLPEVAKELAAPVTPIITYPPVSYAPSVIAYPPAAAAPAPTVISIIQPAALEQPYVPPGEPAIPTLPDIRTEDLQISSPEIELGKSVDVAVSVLNIGDGRGSEEITFQVNGQIQKRQVTLGPGAAQLVVFTFFPQKIGRNSVVVDGLRGFFDVKAPPELPPGVPAPPGVAPSIPKKIEPTTGLPYETLAAKMLDLMVKTGTTQREVDEWVKYDGVDYALAMLTSRWNKMKGLTPGEVARIAVLRELLAALRAKIVRGGMQPTSAELRQISEWEDEIRVIESAAKPIPAIQPPKVEAPDEYLEVLAGEREIPVGPAPDPALLSQYREVLASAKHKVKVGSPRAWVNIPGYGLQYASVAIPQLEGYIRAVS